MHVYREEDRSGWQLTYFGRLKAFDEALTIVGEAEALRPGLTKQLAVIMSDSNNLPRLRRWTFCRRILCEHKGAPMRCLATSGGEALH
jgi:hypothetical protein